MFWAEEYAGESKNFLNECAERMINAADACAAMAGMEWNHPRYSRQALKTACGYERKFQPPPRHVCLSPNFGHSEAHAGLPLLPSRPGEFHPEPLTEPDVILSHHPAHAIA